MKNSKYKKPAGKMTIILYLAFASGALAMAQPKPDTTMNSEVREAHERLMILMSSTEEAIKYVAPLEVYDDIRMAWNNPDLLAENSERHIRYIAPKELQAIEAVYLVNANPPEYSHTYTIPNILVSIIRPTVQ